MTEATQHHAIGFADPALMAIFNREVGQSLDFICRSEGLHNLRWEAFAAFESQSISKQAPDQTAESFKSIFISNLPLQMSENEFYYLKSVFRLFGEHHWMDFKRDDDFEVIQFENGDQAMSAFAAAKIARLYLSVRRLDVRENRRALNGSASGLELLGPGIQTSADSASASAGHRMQTSAAPAHGRGDNTYPRFVWQILVGTLPKGLPACVLEDAVSRAGKLRARVVRSGQISTIELDTFGEARKAMDVIEEMGPAGRKPKIIELWMKFREASAIMEGSDKSQIIPTSASTIPAPVPAVSQGSASTNAANSQSRKITASEDAPQIKISRLPAGMRKVALGNALSSLGEVGFRILDVKVEAEGPFDGSCYALVEYRTVKQAHRVANAVRKKGLDGLDLTVEKLWEGQAPP